MSMSPDLNNQAYQFFIEEVPELLQTIETELLAVRSDRSPAKVHELMRAAHSIKGGAAFAGIDGIVAIAHRLEDIFRALYDETVEIDTDFEGLLLQAYDHLRLPLTEQINTHTFDADAAIAAADLVFSQIEERLGDALDQVDNYMPSSSDLNVDLVESIFENDVAQGLDRLKLAIESGEHEEIARILHAEAEGFFGFAEFLNLSGFAQIAQTVLAALNAHPDQVLSIAQQALADFEVNQKAILEGDRVGGSPSAMLTALAETGVVEDDPLPVFNPTQNSLHSEPAVEGEPQRLSLAELLNGKHAAAPAETSKPSFLPVAEVDIADLTPPRIPELKPAGDRLIEMDADDDPLPIADILGSAIHSPIVDMSTASPRDESMPNGAFLAPQTSEKTVVQPNFKRDTPDRKQLQELSASSTSRTSASLSTTSNISVRVDLARLERMNNVLGELTVNRNTFALENEQMQEAIEELMQRFTRFREAVEGVQNVSDALLIAAEYNYPRRAKYASDHQTLALDRPSAGPELEATLQPAMSELLTSTADASLTGFDSLEMDRYSALNSLMQEVLEEAAQLEEAVNDVALFSGRSSRVIRQERQMLSQLQDDLMWSRMMPIGEVLNRFPRVLRELSASHQKSVNLKIVGTEVQVEKGILEKLYDPLLHLLRNAFDHGIESPDIRLQRGKPEQGEIEICADHQSNQTVIEVRDDGQGLNLERISSRALERGLISSEEMAIIPESQLLELVFEPGFSTASQVSEISGRGIGLDVVKEQIQSLKGTVTVTSAPGKGSIFTLRLPFTLTIAKLMVCSVGSTTIALPTDSIARIITPRFEQIHEIEDQRVLSWQDESIPIYQFVNLLRYNHPLPELIDRMVIPASADNEAKPLLIVYRELGFVALEVDRLVAEQELVIKPFGAIIDPPSYIFGCTILGSGNLIPVVNASMLLEECLDQRQSNLVTVTSETESFAGQKQGFTDGSRGFSQISVIPTVLVVDDSTTARQALIQTLQKAGYQALQARDGCEAIEHLRRNSKVQLIVCDVEMPNMNGFEFLDCRRKDPNLATIPVVMLTTRSNSKHRGLAMHLGADAYFTKPYIELEFLSSIQEMIEQRSLPLMTSS